MEDTPSSDSLQLKVAFDRKERRAAQWAAAMRGPLWRRPVVLLPAAVIAGLLLSWALRAPRPAPHPGGPSVVRTLSFLLAIVFLIYVTRRNRRRREEVERHERQPDVYTLDERGLEISGAEDLVMMSWSSMTRVHETGRFFLFVSGSEVQYLPKRRLDAAQEAQVRALIARHGPGMKRIAGSS